MNDRERLIDLLGEAEIREDILSSHGKPLGFYDVKMVYPDCADLLADYLIANGVTVQKHGRWIKSGIMEPGYDCSECGQAYAWWNCSEAHYCPNCGARMDGEA